MELKLVSTIYLPGRQCGIYAAKAQPTPNGAGVYCVSSDFLSSLCRSFRSRTTSSGLEVWLPEPWFWGPGSAMISL